MGRRNKGSWVSWINRGDGGADGVKGGVDSVSLGGEEDRSTG